MAEVIPTQHPAVVLRSHYRHLRALLAVAMIAVVGLTVAIVVMATHSGATDSRSAAPVNASSASPDGPRELHAPGQGFGRVPAESTR